MPVEPGDRAGQYRQLLTGVVADHANVATDLRGFGHEGELSRRDELELARVITEKAEVMDGIPIHGNQLDFLLIQEYGLRADRARRDDVAVRENDPALCVDHETGGLARLIALGIEGARAVDLDRDDARGDALERAIPTLFLGLDLKREKTGSNDDRVKRSDANMFHGAQFYVCRSLVTTVAAFCSGY